MRIKLINDVELKIDISKNNVWSEFEKYMQVVQISCKLWDPFSYMLIWNSSMQIVLEETDKWKKVYSF